MPAEPHRRGETRHQLIVAQRDALAPVRDALVDQHRAATSFGQVLASRRLENVHAALRFLDRIDDTTEWRAAASAGLLAGMS